jgi:pimeloyl-ACP methyl ester carboxylesterase
MEKEACGEPMNSQVEKPLALLIPGLDGTGKLFYRQIDRLSTRYRVLPWQFRPRYRFDLSDLAEEIARGTENERNGSMLVVGESFGGTIAMQFALDYSERLQRLVLVNTFPFYRRRMRIRLACRLAELLKKRMIQALKDVVVERALAAEGILREDRIRYQEAMKLVYHPAYCRRLQLVREVDLRSRLREIRIPTLLFASGRDKIVPSLTEARFMASRIPHAEIYEFPHAGHALLLTPGFCLAEYFDVST